MDIAVETKDVSRSTLFGCIRNFFSPPKSCSAHLLLSDAEQEVTWKAVQALDGKEFKILRPGKGQKGETLLQFQKVPFFAAQAVTGLLLHAQPNVIGEVAISGVDVKTDLVKTLAVDLIGAHYRSEVIEGLVSFFETQSKHFEALDKVVFRKVSELITAEFAPEQSLPYQRQFLEAKNQFRGIGERASPP